MLSGYCRMKATVLVLLFCFFYIECRKSIAIDKNANTAFINMEGGGIRPGPNAKPASPTASPVAQSPQQPPKVVVPTQPSKPAVAPQPTVQQPVQTTKTPAQIKPVPVNPPPVNKPVTTPGPGYVKQLITFYDSQGKASVIRPYSYSQAVKQG